MSPVPAATTFPFAIPKPPPGKQGVISPQTTVYRGVTKRMEMIRPDQCTVDLEVQRPHDEFRVKELVKKWNDVAAGVCYVSRRSDGTTVILDGQTRFGALQALGQGGVSRETIVYRGLTKPQEAEIFRILNNTKKPDALCLFNIACVEEDPHALAIRAMVRKYGYRTERSHKNSLIAIKAVENAYDRDKASAEAALKFIRDTWGTAKNAVNGTIYAGMALMIFRYGPGAIDFAQFKDRILKAGNAEPTALIGRSKTNAEIRSCKLPDAFAEILVGIYNKGPGQKKLPPWITGS